MHYGTNRNKWHIVNSTKKVKTLISILNKLLIYLGIKAFKVPLPPPEKKSPKQLVVNVFKLLTNSEKKSYNNYHYSLYLFPFTKFIRVAPK